MQDPENQKTMSFGQNHGFWVGYASIYDAYVTGHQGMWESGLDSYLANHPELAEEIESDPSKYCGVGELIMHSLTTPIIEVAVDGNTAKGTWYSPGQVTQFGGGNWIWERYGVDFAIRHTTNWMGDSGWLHNISWSIMDPHAHWAMENTWLKFPVRYVTSTRFPS